MKNLNWNSLWLVVNRLVAGTLTIAILLFLYSDAGVVNAQNRTQSLQPDAPLAQLIVDPTFEAGNPWPGWTVQTSSNFGTPMCTQALCGTVASAPPFAGLNWVWFGGISAAETASTGQSVVIPVGVTASLTFQMRIGAVTTPFNDTMTVTVDGITQQVYTEPAVAEGAYTLRTINLNAFATGTSHAILFTYVHPGTGTSNFNVDDINLTTAPVTAAGVMISGRVRTSAEGRGLTGALVHLTDQNGASRWVITGKGGSFNFDDLEPGQTYVVAVTSRRFTFQPQVIQITDNVTDVNFIPE